MAPGRPGTSRKMTGPARGSFCPGFRPEISRLDPFRGQTNFIRIFHFFGNWSSAFSDAWDLPARTLSMASHYFHELFLGSPWYIHAIPSDLNASSIRCPTLPNLGNTRVLDTQGASSRKSMFLVDFPRDNHITWSIWHQFWTIFKSNYITRHGGAI